MENLVRTVPFYDVLHKEPPIQSAGTDAYLINAELKRAPATVKESRIMAQWLRDRLAAVSTTDETYNLAEEDQSVYLFAYDRLSALVHFAQSLGAQIFVLDAGTIAEYERVEAAHTRIAKRLMELGQNVDILIAVRNARPLPAGRRRRHAIESVGELLDFGTSYNTSVAPNITCGIGDPCVEVKHLQGQSQVKTAIVDEPDGAAVDHKVLKTVSEAIADGVSEKFIIVESEWER